MNVQTAILNKIVWVLKEVAISFLIVVGVLIIDMVLGSFSLPFCDCCLAQFLLWVHLLPSRQLPLGQKTHVLRLMYISYFKYIFLQMVFQRYFMVSIPSEIVTSICEKGMSQIFFLLPAGLHAFHSGWLYDNHN